VHTCTCTQVNTHRFLREGILANGVVFFKVLNRMLLEILLLSFNLPKKKEIHNLLCKGLILLKLERLHTEKFTF